MLYSVFEQDSQRVFTISTELWQQNQQKYPLLLRYLAVPVQEDSTTLWLAIESLNNIRGCETFSFLTGKIVEPVVIGQFGLKQLLQALNPQNDAIYAVAKENTLYEPQSDYLSDSVELDPDEPMIKLFNQLLEQSIQHRASDIHLEPSAESYLVRFRIDGILQLQQQFNFSLGGRLLSRLKLLAKLDISETRLPQDGHFSFKTTFAETLELRLSTLPTQFGEKMVLRLQHNQPTTLNFTELGMTAAQVEMFKTALLQPQGLILVTGPTGSGKSLTLYSGLSFLNSEDKHLMTAEDPIEIPLAGVIQTQVNNPIGLTFVKLLRTFLRQDPDVIMVGEIRDQETAEMALRAAQTGHLVLSTLHTNTARSAITRLQQLGIQQSELENTLLLVIAQRLLRKKCQNCCHLSQTACQCTNGYTGRIGVYQFLVRQTVNQQESFISDYDSLEQAALPLLEKGITDQAEVDRVLGTQQFHY
ncbi:protein transporter HofB [Mergibacter septicus]|uniref:GspE/PulE family protein n=1 Tax=Mergibacter septicus TaxID=221402 RepID=UPI00117968ED|nr:GspE/PulE family protein [Mergibacter septicus]AWX13890.1 protein transporter HofB [Mergibacter septicus]